MSTACFHYSSRDGICNSCGVKIPEDYFYMSENRRKTLESDFFVNFVNRNDLEFVIEIIKHFKGLGFVAEILPSNQYIKVIFKKKVKKS